MDTFHASPEREGSEKLQEQLNIFNLIEEFKDFFGTLPNLVFLLNSRRQILFSNQDLIHDIAHQELSDFLGKRVGEYLNCIHSNDCESGCGTSEHCKVCGAVNVVIQSQKNQKKVINECSVTSMVNEQMVNYNFQVSSAPLKIKNEVFYIFTILDISHEKRRKNLERIFFHDVLNTAGSLATLSDMITTIDNDAKKLELLKIIRSESKELLEEIMAQKNLTEAETGELAIQNERLSTIEMLDLISLPFQENDKYKAFVDIDEDSDDVLFYSDKTILNRILKNMIKNAIEASENEESILIGTEETTDSIRFYVKNKTYIPRHIQLQLFQRNFSTKSKDRGLGTYSMKLLGEEYLNGKVSFISNEEEGTTFIFEIPR